MSYYQNNNYHFRTPPSNNYDPGRRIKTEQHVSFKDIGESVVEKRVRFDASTSYREHYNKKYDQNFLKIINPERQVPMPQYIRPEYRFEGVSRYKSDFIDSPYMDKIRIANSQKINKQYQPLEQGRFQGSSSYKQEFKGYKISVKEEKEVGSWVNPPLSQKVDYTSSYKDDFRGFSIREEVECPVKKLPVPIVNPKKGQKHLYYSAEENRFV